MTRVAASALAALLAGCAVHDRSLPRFTVATIGHSPETVRYDLRAHQGGSASSRAVGYYRQRTEALLGRAFAQVRPGPVEDGALHLSLSFDVQGQGEGNPAFLLLTLFSLGAIPSYSTSHHSLDAKVQRPGQPEWMLGYTRSVTTWYWTPAILALLVEDPEYVENAAVDSMILELIADLQLQHGSQSRE